MQIFCVAFGSHVNTNSLQQLTSQTGGHYYLAATTADLAVQFQKIVKDIDGQYDAAVGNPEAGPWASLPAVVPGDLRRLHGHL